MILTRLLFARLLLVWILVVGHRILSEPMVRK
jgi:hypothetical protein